MKAYIEDNQELDEIQGSEEENTSKKRVLRSFLRWITGRGEQGKNEVPGPSGFLVAGSRTYK
jgi:hypothetical protein